MIRDKDAIVRLVAFCVTMQHDGGIKTKSPGYIDEKFERYFSFEPMENITGGMDLQSKKLFAYWMDQWEELLR